MRERARKGEQIELINNFVPISLFSPFVYCRKVDDLLIVLCQMREKFSERLVLRSQRAAGTSSEVFRKMEGLLSLSSDPTGQQ